jgi:hypothetical protein
LKVGLNTILMRMSGVVLAVLWAGLAGGGPCLAGPLPALSLPDASLQVFGEVPALPSLKIKPALQDSATSVDQAANAKAVLTMLGVQLSLEEKKFLDEHKFLLIPRRATKFKGKLEGWCEYDEMLSMFDEIGGPYAASARRPEHARLVTPDVMLHGFHKYLENSLEYLERVELAALLRRFVYQAQARALEARGRSEGLLAERFEMVAAQLTVPLVLLENAQWGVTYAERVKMGKGTKDLADKPDITESLEGALQKLGKYQKQFSPEVFGRLSQELKNIYQAAGVAVAPLYGQYAESGAGQTDYTQYRPRSHYAKSSLLRGYFRAMMYLGRNSYRLGKPVGLTDALLLAYIMAVPGSDGQPIVRDWQKLMALTTFYAGYPDDICYDQWRSFLVNVMGTDKFSPAEAVNPEVLTKISQHLGELRPPRVLSEVIIGERVPGRTKEELLAGTKAFRLFGQRFSFDGWILGRLSAGEEQTAAPLPSTPSALFIPAALGDPLARELAGTFLRQGPQPFSADQVAQFDQRLALVQADLKKVTDAEWYRSVGSVWLKLLGTLPGPYGAGYPWYMQGKLFPVKQLQTFLGSYTEFKHDTLLYAKQSYAEMGSGEDEQRPPVPKGLVEPNLAFWQELQRLVAYTAAGFKQFGLFKQELEEYGRLNTLKKRVDLYTALAVKELQGTPLTEAEYEDLRTMHLTFLASPFGEGMVLAEKDKLSGLVADIHTDALKGQILYEATGEPYFMLALVGNEGQSRLTVGVAFNHCEFTAPLGRRYTDADWQARAYASPPQTPPKNFWYQGLTVK